ncbi:histidine kinase [Luteococcus sediminum]
MPDDSSPATAPARRLTGLQWLVALLGTAYYLSPLLAPRARGHLDPWLVTPLMGGALASLLLVALPMRRHPLVLAAMAALWPVSAAVFGAALVAQEELARTRRRPVGLATAALLCAAKVLGVPLWAALGQPPGQAAWVEVTISCIGIGVATLVGWLRQATRQAEAARAVASTARQESFEARLEQARLAERERIAREMHDVVAHRISLVALHSGALSHRLRESDAESAELAGLIQTNAKASLVELRSMLATLRGSQDSPEPPQPTLTGLRCLVAEAAEAGQQVHLEVDAPLVEIPEPVSRNAFRIIQEGITNARRHAPGAPTVVQVQQRDGWLRLRVANPLADLAAPDRSGSGLGLVGVAERVEQLGGELVHGSDGAQFVLEARVPLATPHQETA